MARRRIEDLDKNFKVVTPTGAQGLRWLPASHRQLTMRGLPWFKKNKGLFNRLPLRAKGKVRDAVWEIGQAPAGACTAFRSDTTRLHVRMTNVSTYAMPHMALSASNGATLYSGTPERMRPWAVAIPDQQNVTFERLLFENAPPVMREYRLHLPPYQFLQALELGFDKRAKILAPSPTALPKPIVFYGTSITQGGCAATAGGDYVSTVGRMLNLEVVNLGFSGNGKGEPALAELMTEIDACLYVLDYYANVRPDELAQTLPPFVEILRAKRPGTPILLMTDLMFAKCGHSRKSREELYARRDVALLYYAQQRAAGHRDIHLVDGFSLLPYGADAAHADGVHLTGHGFQMVAERLAPAIEQIVFCDV